MIKIVLIEDLPIVLEGIRVILNQVDDFEVIGEYRNGKAFIDQIHRINPDIVLTDIDMPVMNGVETTRNALKIYPLMKFVALSMYGDSKYYYDMIEAGARGFVLKQSSMEELETAIREVHAGDNFFSKTLLHEVLKSLQQENKTQDIVNYSEPVKLKQRETELLQLICQGFTNKELAERMFVSIKTIESNKAQLMQKTGSRNNAGLIIWAIKNKIVKI